jgi:hypothetical protein
LRVILQNSGEVFRNNYCICSVNKPCSLWKQRPLYYNIINKEFGRNILFVFFVPTHTIIRNKSTKFLFFTLRQDAFSTFYHLGYRNLKSITTLKTRISRNQVSVWPFRNKVRGTYLDFSKWLPNVRQSNSWRYQQNIIWSKKKKGVLRLDRNATLKTLVNNGTIENIRDNKKKERIRCVSPCGSFIILV